MKSVSLIASNGINIPRTVVCLLIILFSQFQVFASHTSSLVESTQQKLIAKEYSITSGVVPNSNKVEVVNQDFPLIEVIQYKIENAQEPVVDFSCLVRKSILDLFRVITPSNAP